VLSVAIAKIQLKEQGLIAGTKRSRQANKADRLQVRHSNKAVGHVCFVLRPAFFVLSLFLVLALPNAFCTIHYNLNDLLFLDIYGLESIIILMRLHGLTLA
jgi:hypothetical protein